MSEGDERAVTENDGVASTVGRRHPPRTDPLSRQGRNRHRTSRARIIRAVVAYFAAMVMLVVATPTTPTHRRTTTRHAVLIPPVEYVRSPDEDRASRGVPRETTTTTARATTTTIRARQRPATTTTTATPADVDEWGLPPLLRRIGGCESTGRPDGPLLWTALNRSGSGASGAFQYLRSTWNGYGGYSEARWAPPAVQIQRALADFSRSTSPWRSSRTCWG